MSAGQTRRADKAGVLTPHRWREGQRLAGSSLSYGVSPASLKCRQEVIST